MSWYDNLVVGKTESSCLKQGNKWEGKKCQEVSVKDWCHAKLTERNNEARKREKEDGSFYGLIDEDNISLCYREVKLPEYKQNQVMAYYFGKGSDEFLERQRLKPYQVERAIELVAKNPDELDLDGPALKTWRELSGKLTSYQNLTREQVEKFAKDNSVQLEGYYQRIRDIMAFEDSGESTAGLSDEERAPVVIMEEANLADLVLREGKNTKGLAKIPLSEKQFKKLLEFHPFEEIEEETSWNFQLGRARTKFIREGIHDEERLNRLVGVEMQGYIQDTTPELVSYAIKKGDLSRNIYINHKLSTSDIDIAMDIDPKYEQIYKGTEIEYAQRGEDDVIECEDRPLVDYILENRLDEEGIKKVKHARDKYRLLDDVYEHQKLSSKQVDRAIDMGYFITTLLHYQKVSKPKLKEIIANIDIKTDKGNKIFNAMWSNKSLSKDLRLELAEKAGIKDLVGSGHYVWSAVYPTQPKEAMKIMKRMRDAMNARIPENPLKVVVGEYPMEIR